MWEELSLNEKNEYKKMILSFASLTEMFAQKNDDSDCSPSPIINSKFQETMFQKAFHAIGEDIGNTSYDVSIKGNNKKYLIGIKTFGIGSGDQKIAQFKANLNDWSNIINEIKSNAQNDDGTWKSRTEINEINNDLYIDLAKRISKVRNDRIRSSIANLQGFKIESNDNVESVYHVLMPSKKGDEPQIFVGETAYDLIDETNIIANGCTSKDHPANFYFTDGKHRYKYTAADSQLHMAFGNESIIIESWPVRYAADAYKLFEEISKKINAVNKKQSEIEASYSWKIVNEKGEVNKFSGFNAFYGVGSKVATADRSIKINRIFEKYNEIINGEKLAFIKKYVEKFMLNSAKSDAERLQKAKLRDEIIDLVSELNNENFKADIRGLLYRPVNEMYIPIPNAKNFHNSNPNFFGEGIGTFKDDGKTLKKSKKEREFTLIFEPSGDAIVSFIAEETGKAIESAEKQTNLGEWVLKQLFQLEDYELLTSEKLEELEINAIRLYKLKNNEEIHIEFIWIGDNLPDDYIGN